MSNLPIILQDNGGNPPVLPEAMLAQYGMLAEQMASGFTGSFNHIKPGKMDFTLVEGGVARRVDNGQVVGVCLGMAKYDYCSWYEKSYVDGQEPEQPNLVWEWPDHNQFPAALPKQYHQKMNRQGQPRWDFRIARRSVWALVQPDAAGQPTLNIDNPYILDVTSSSLYGTSDTVAGLYKWSGLIQLCNRFSQPPNFICSPAMFLTQLRIDPQSTVAGVILFKPMITNGALAYLDSNTFMHVVEAMQSQATKDMLKVKEILEWPRTSSAHVGVNSSASAMTVPTVTMPQQPMAQPSVPMQTPAQPKPASQTPPMQTATAVTPEESVAGSEDLLAQAQMILNQPPAAPAQPAKQPQATAPQPPAGNVNAVTADALRAFSNVL